MNYKLAKKLKDAGFPQSKKYCSDVFFEGFGVPRSKESVGYPSLSGLIAACRDDFWTLGKRNGGGWRATNGKLGGDEIKTYGKTPDEALAKLWLALL